MSISKVRLPNNTEEDIKAKYLIQSSSSDAVSEEFVTRTTTEDATVATIQKIYGNTIKWNQLIQNGNFETTTGWAGNKGTIAVSNNVLTFTASSPNSNCTVYRADASIVSGHKYLFSFYVTCSKAITVRGSVGSDNGENQSITASTRTHYSKIITSTADSTYAYCYLNRNSALSNNDAVLVENVNLFDLTAIYGSGNEPTVSEFEAQYPAEYYPYTLPTLLSNSATSIQSKDSNNNVIGNCDLNIPTLTGKLNGAGSSVVIFPDGMKYDGTNRDEMYGNIAKKKVGQVDMGTLSWEADSYANGHYHTDSLGSLSSPAATGFNRRCSKYSTYPSGFSWSDAPDKSIGGNTSSARLYLKDSSCHSLQDVIAAVSGVDLVFELATPEEYILDNALQLQYPVVAGGTEMVLPTSGTAPMKMDVIYGNAADATSNLSSNFISVDSMKAFLNNLGTQMGGTWNMQYNNGKFEFTFSSS